MSNDVDITTDDFKGKKGLDQIKKELTKVKEDMDQKDQPKKKEDSENTSKRSESSKLSFCLVVIMLGILGLVLLVLLVMPVFFPQNKSLTEYYKYAFPALLGAFGAWIGAGAAYFFGKENLQESSRSTENAMKIQQESFQHPPEIEQIKDMALTAMNSNFIFRKDKDKDKDKDSDVISVIRKKLTEDEFKGYWFVPVVTSDTGILEDVIHAQVFWNPEFAKGIKNLDLFVSKMDESESLKKLHGESFYIKVNLNDKINEVNDLINRRSAEVAIVVDENEKPTHCLSKNDLRNILKS